MEEAAENYAQQHNELLGFDCDCEPIQTGPELKKKAVIFGAEWQKQTMENALQTEYEKGLFDMREEMMKALVNGEVVKDIHNQLSVKSEPLNDAFGDIKSGDKVKITILKEEQQ